MANSRMLLATLILGVIVSQGESRGGSNSNINTNTFTRRSASNLNSNSNTFGRQGGGKRDSDYGSTTQSPEDLMRSVKSRLSRGLSKRDLELTIADILTLLSACNAGLFEDTGYRELLKKIFDMQDLSSGDSARGLGRSKQRDRGGAGAHSNYNSNSNQFRSAPDDSMPGMRRSYGGQSNVNSNTNTFGRSNGAASLDDDVQEPNRRSTGNTNSNINSNTFRRSAQNRNVNTNEFRG